MKDRLGRLDRIYPDKLIYFITFCTLERRALLANPSVHKSFRAFGLIAEQQHIFIGRYVIMPDHLHFFVHFAQPERMPAWIKSLKNSLSKTLREDDVPSPHFQKGYFDHLMRSSESFEEKWNYVKQNPVRSLLVEDANTWSYQGEIVPLPFD